MSQCSQQDSGIRYESESREQINFTAVIFSTPWKFFFFSFVLCYNAAFQLPAKILAFNFFSCQLSHLPGETELNSPQL